MADNGEESVMKHDPDHGDQNGAERQADQEMKPDVDELMRKIEEEKEKRFDWRKGYFLFLIITVAL